MYRIEMITKASTMQDIIPSWVASGRVDNSAEGQIVFESADFYNVANGTVHIEVGEKRYFYNLSDFYRVKAVKIPDHDRDMFDDAA